VVFSRTLNKVSWNNTRPIDGDLASEARKLKDTASEGIVMASQATLPAS
jgi:hypothetical protein